MYALGRVFNVVHEASGVHIPLTNAGAITYVTFVAAGTNTATVKESVNGASEQALDVTMYPFKGPGVGGTWTAMAEQDDTLTNNDATNDCMVFTIQADTLSEGFNCVEVTMDAGTCIAIIHDLLSQRNPANLPSSVV